MSKLANKIALVTGGSRGIGAAIVKQLAAEGAEVVFTYVNSTEKAERLIKELGELWCQSDNGKSRYRKPGRYQQSCPGRLQRIGANRYPCQQRRAFRDWRN